MGGGGCGGVPAFCARPFSSTNGPRGTVRRKRQQQQPQQQQQQQHPSRESLQLLPSAQRSWTEQPTMWRAPLLQLFLVFTCCVRWCHSEGERLLLFFYIINIIIITVENVFSLFEVSGHFFTSDPPLVCTCCSSKPHQLLRRATIRIVHLCFAVNRNCVSDDI